MTLIRYEFDTLGSGAYTPAARNEFPSGELAMLNRSLAVFLIAAFAFATLSLAETHEKIHQPKLTPQNSGTTQGLIAVSPVDSRVVWASGRGGTFLVPPNGGETWKAAA